MNRHAPGLHCRFETLRLARSGQRSGPSSLHGGFPAVEQISARGLMAQDEAALSLGRSHGGRGQTARILPWVST